MERFKYSHLHSHLTTWNKVFKLHNSLILVAKKNTLSTETVKVIWKCKIQLLKLILVKASESIIIQVHMLKKK